MTTSSQIFDFTPYFTTILYIAPDEVDVQVLSGGYANLTARATFSRPINLPTYFDFPTAISSVILKKATPYMHAIPSQAMPVGRQAVEALALRILQGAEPSVPYVAEALARVPTLRVPQSVFHDTKQNILWMTDLGEGKILTDYILSDSPSKSKVEELAGALGRFIAELHRGTKNPPPEMSSTLSDSRHVTGILTSDAERIIREDSLRYRNDPDEMQVLMDRMYSVLDPENNLEPCLGMVDLWAGNILVSTHGELGLVDWEHFGLSDPGCEVGLFVGDLHLCLFLGERTAEIATAVQAFVAELASAYLATSPDAMSTHFKRRFLITHGRELVIGMEMFTRPFDAASKARSVEAGLQCLRAAGAEDGTIDYDILKMLPAEIVEDIMLFLAPDM
ncbi:hypothetical protein FRC05_007491 [Tulasnella sp. 425]|nr:hypothetical protein FRC05_007491 [Tulasnella sp. 425]